MIGHKPQPAILARIIRDIPTFGGTVREGRLPTTTGSEGRCNLSDTKTGTAVVSGVRRGQEFEFAEITHVGTTHGINAISIDDI